MRLAWLTDIHLDCLKRNAIWRLGKKVRKSGADAAIVTGDIATGARHTLKDDLYEGLKTLRYMLDKDFPIHFILGNHDYWHSSFEEVHRRLRSEPWASGPRYTWLGNVPYLEPAPGVAIIGIDGWYDGQAGNIHTSRLIMNDWFAIREMLPFGISKYFAPNMRMRELTRLSEEGCGRLCRILDESLLCAKHILIATHVPPFREASLYQGKVCGDESAPFYVNKTLGRTICFIAENCPHIQFTILAGHTHERATFRPMPNVVCHVGQAKYGRSQISGMIDITEEGITVTHGPPTPKPR